MPHSVTTSTTMSTEDVSEDFYTSTQQAILQLFHDKFGHDKSKDEIIKALEHCQYLHRIPLPPSKVPIEQAQKDFRRERVLLNHVAFIPDKIDEDRCHAFALTLQVLVERLSRSSAVYSTEKYSDASQICDVIMQRACRTSAGADSFFTVQTFLCPETTFMTQKTQDNDPPIFIDVFLSERMSQSSIGMSPPSTPTTYLQQTPQPTEGTDDHSVSEGNSAPPTATSILSPSISSDYDLCARIQISNSFAIFNVESVDEITGNEQQDPKPWLDVETIVIDESNFREGKHWRRLHLIVTNPETGITYSSSDEICSLQKASLGRISGRKVLRELGTWLSSSTNQALGIQRSDETASQRGSPVPSDYNNNSSANNIFLSTSSLILEGNESDKSGSMVS